MKLFRSNSKVMEFSVLYNRVPSCDPECFRLCLFASTSISPASFACQSFRHFVLTTHSALASVLPEPMPACLVSPCFAVGFGSVNHITLSFPAEGSNVALVSCVRKTKCHTTFLLSNLQPQPSDHDSSCLSHTRQFPAQSAF